MPEVVSKKNIVIVGAGFAGVTAALLLAKQKGLDAAGYVITLIDRHHHHLYTPALYEIAAIPRDYASDPSLRSSVLIPIADIIRGKCIHFLCDEFVSLDASEKQIFLKERGGLKYDFLIFALGSETNYFDIPGLKEYSLPLKTPDDAIRMRNRIENTAAKESLIIVVGGGGSSGVELIAEFVNFVCLLQQYRRANHRNVCNIQFILVEAADTILPGFNPHTIAQAEKRLHALDVIIKTQTAITAVDPAMITFPDGATQHYDLLIWTGGVKGPSVLETLNLPLSSKKALAVDAYLRVRGHNNIFAIGDNATFINSRTGSPLVWNVPAAEAEARYVADTIATIIEGNEIKKFVPARRYPFILAVGEKYAIADLIFIEFSGFMGWLAKILVELRYLLFVLPVRSAFSLWWQNVRLYRAND